MIGGDERLSRLARRARSLAVPTLLLAILNCGDENPLYVRAGLYLGTLSPPVKVLDLPLDISPDGKLLLFARRDTLGQPEGIFCVGIPPDSVPRYLMPVDAFFISPRLLRFSPDSKRIAYVKEADGATRVCIFDLGTGVETPISPMAYFADAPDWDPTGRFIVYGRPFLRAGDPDSLAGIHIVDLQSGNEWSLRHAGGATFGGGPRWSPDGSWIAFWYGTKLRPGIRVPTPLHIYRTHPDGTDYTDLTPKFESSHDHVTWIEGGKRMLFEVQGPSESATFVSNADGTDRQLWPIDLLRTPLAVVSRDGGFAVFVGRDRSGQYGVLWRQGSRDTRGTARTRVTFTAVESLAIASAP